MKTKKFRLDFFDVDDSVIYSESVTFRMETDMSDDLFQDVAQAAVQIYADDRMPDIDANYWKIQNIEETENGKETVH